MVLLGYLWVSFEIDTFGEIDVARDFSEEFRAPAWIHFSRTI